MGYVMLMLQADFFIAHRHHCVALEAIKQLDPRATYPDSTDPHFDFVDSLSYRQAETLQEALYLWRWVVKLDDDGFSAMEPLISKTARLHSILQQTKLFLSCEAC